MAGKGHRQTHKTGWLTGPYSKNVDDQRAQNRFDPLSTNEDYTFRAPRTGIPVMNYGAPDIEARRTYQEARQSALLQLIERYLQGDPNRVTPQVSNFDEMR
jgi:hypothetical protein